MTQSLEQLGFHTVGYGCTMCIGNSGPLPEAIAAAIRDHKLVVASVLSGHMLEYWSPEKVQVAGEMVPLKEAMIQGQVPYWHSPAAMWLALELYAFAGCVFAVLQRGWLTRGARIDRKSDPKKPDSETSPKSEN